LKGIFTELNVLIASEETKHKLAIDVERLTRMIQRIIDFDEIPIEELKDRYARAAASVALYQNGYKSVVRGEGLFVNVENCKKKEYLAKLYNNARMTKRQKEAALELIAKTIKLNEIPGQLKFMPDGTYEEEATIDELIQMLREDANSAEATQGGDS
jgi:hypothetical protein